LADFCPTGNAGVIQFTSNEFEFAYKRAGLTAGFLDMPGTLPQKTHHKSTHRWLLTAFMIYCAMIGGLLAFVTVFPDAVTPETQAESTRAVAATKPARYEGVIANWNWYRARDARADAR
jgi:hypothetical protein